MVKQETVMCRKPEICALIISLTILQPCFLNTGGQLCLNCFRFSVVCIFGPSSNQTSYLKTIFKKHLKACCDFSVE